MATINVALNTLVQNAIIKSYAGYKEELGLFSKELNANYGLGDTVRVILSTAGTAGNLTNFSGSGSAGLAPASVVLSNRLGDPIPLTDEQLANLGSNIGDVVQQNLDNAIAATAASAHALVTAVNFPLVTGVTAKALSAVTFADFSANVNAVKAMTGNRPNLQKLSFICTPAMFNLIVDGISSVYATASRSDMSDAVGLGTSFKYKGITIIQSLNLPAGVKGGYFTDGTGIAIAYGSDKSVTDMCQIEKFVDSDSGLPVTVRSFYDNSFGGWKFIPYVISGVAVGNPNGIVIPSWT